MKCATYFLLSPFYKKISQYFQQDDLSSRWLCFFTHKPIKTSTMPLQGVTFDDMLMFQKQKKQTMQHFSVSVSLRNSDKMFFIGD